MSEPIYTAQSTYGGWIGVDLDGTTAFYEAWGDGSIGPPVKEMVERIQRWLAAGVRVKFVTARVSSKVDPETVKEQRQLIRDWSLEHIGTTLEATAEKDFRMIALWDDRAITIEHNTGRILTTELG